MKRIIFYFTIALLPLSVHAQKAEKIFNEAAVYYDSGNHNKAIPLFEKCIQKEYYSDGDIFSWLNVSYNAVGNSEKAIECIFKGYEMFPNNLSLMYDVSYHYVNNGNYNRALEIIDKALIIDSSYAEFYYMKGLCHLKLNEDKNAIAAFKMCSKINLEYEWGNYQIALYYYNQAYEMQTTGDGINDDNRMDYEDMLISSNEFAEKAFSVTKDIHVKMDMAHCLANSYRALMETDNSYEEKFEFYQNYINSGGLQ